MRTKNLMRRRNFSLLKIQTNMSSHNEASNHTTSWRKESLMGKRTCMPHKFIFMTVAMRMTLPTEIVSMMSWIQWFDDFFLYFWLHAFVLHNLWSSILNLFVRVASFIYGNKSNREKRECAPEIFLCLFKGFSKFVVCSFDDAMSFYK